MGHSTSDSQAMSHPGSIALVGHPNVGKSAIFQRLTGQRVVISNYPGTTVEVTRGASRYLPDFELVDTPGVIAFPPHSDDERVTEHVLLDEPLKAILQVGDAKNLRKTLLLTVHLAEMGRPLVLALNMMDEARARGVVVNHTQLSEILDVTVIPTTATRGQGFDDLTDALQAPRAPQFSISYADDIESAIKAFSVHLRKCGLMDTPISHRSLALLWMSGDQIADDWLCERLDGDEFARLVDQCQALSAGEGAPLEARIQEARLDYVDQVAEAVITDAGGQAQGFGAQLGRLTTHPVWGLLILAVVLYVLYLFVGVFGAGFLVGLLEEGLFGQVINPWVVDLVYRLVPIPFLADLLVGEFGLWTLGMTYALALILPIVATFFLAFGVMEDSGYLPRLAVLSNRLFQSLGLNGKAVLPLVLGLGCVTMATLTTRVLESKRERFLATLLLALAVPCSAQLGVVVGILASVSFTATLIWGSVLFLIFLVVGWLAAKVMPGERTSLLVELPPLRWPMLSNVVLKTLARLEWYLKEVVPLFLFGAALLFVLDRSGILAWMIRAGEPLVTGWLGLPPEASAAFLMGLVRRDFGATGLFVMQSQGLLTPVQVVVAMVTITLFVPCIATVMMIAKERGWYTALGMVALIFPLAFLVGGTLYRLLLIVGWGI